MPPAVDIAQHQGLVRMVVRRYVRWIHGTVCLSVDDLHQVGNMGLMRAAETYDPSRSAFSTYALPWIRHYIRREIIDKLRTVRVPAWAQEKDKPFQPKLSHPIEVSRTGSVARDDNPADPILVTDLMRDRLPPTESPEEAAERASMCALAHRIVNRLRCPRERLVIRKRFFDGLTLQQVGDSLGLTKERVRQIESDALGNLRRHAEDD